MTSSASTNQNRIGFSIPGTAVRSFRHQTTVISAGAFACFANAEWRDPFFYLCLCIFLVLTPSLHAQGCAQCLDSTRATPPSVQAAYRHAILLLGATGATLFIAGTLLLRRNR